MCCKLAAAEEQIVTNVYSFRTSAKKRREAYEDQVNESLIFILAANHEGSYEQGRAR
jgi:hypothetical protein